MTAVESEVQWYIARDGKQYGPVSAVEMAKLVELKHIKPNDLVWRPGFTDWRPAQAVFPATPEPASASMPAASQVAAQSVVAPATGRAVGGGVGAGPAIQAGAGKAGPAAGAAEQPATRTGEAGATQKSRQVTAREGAGRTSGGFGKRLAVATAIVLVLAAGGGALYHFRGLLQQEGSKTSVPVVKAESTPVKTEATSAEAAAPVDTAKLDARLQKSAMWSLIKRDYPDWYEARMKEAETLSGDRSEAAISTFFVKSLVSLRRQHASQALSASTPKLKVIANAFLENLRSLAARSPASCFAFISQGETSPDIVEALAKQDQMAPIQTQVMAIFDAIAEGTKSPTPHEKPQKTDYDALAGELTKLGWSQGDLQLFADPKALATAAPDKVCKMVQDWFTAHLAISDAGTQERLLVETLRPVVAG
jgi:hypothetical protein